jgi:hypothetical protein
MRDRESLRGLSVFSLFRPFRDMHTRSIKLICTTIHTQHVVSALLFSICVFPNKIRAALLTQPFPLQTSSVHLGVLEKQSFLKYEKQNEAPGKREVEQ